MTIQEQIISEMENDGVKHKIWEGGLLMRCNQDSVNGYKGGVMYLLVGVTKSSSRKSFHYHYTRNVDEYFPEVKWNSVNKTLYVRSEMPGSFIGCGGCHIKELQRIWRECGYNIELMNRRN